MNNYNNLDTSKLNYVIYCRKSSEGEDKQVQSLDTQIRELQEHADRNKLNIVKVISESKSAFKTGREGFNEMMELLRTGKANAILVIRANRISRNPVDAGYVISLMDEKKLLYIRTPNSTCYTSSSTDKMMIALELIFSKKDSDDKGDMVKEGQKTKALKGIPHGVATLGFLNDKTEEKGNRKWFVDQERFPKIQILLKMFLTGEWSAGKLHKYAVNELKLTTVKHKKIGGQLIQLSRIYEILTDPIYAGFFFYGGNRYELDTNLPRIITPDEHNKIKMILTKRNIPKTQKHECVFAGFITSPDGNYIGPDMKFQLICQCGKKFAYRDKENCPHCETSIEQMDSPKYLDYTYYYNIAKKKRGEEYKSINENKVLEQLIKEVGDYLPLSKELADWSKRHIKEMRDAEINENLFKEDIIKSEAEDFIAKKKRRREMLAEGLISEDEYKSDIADLEARYKPQKKQVDLDWTKRANEIVDLAQEFVNVMEAKDQIQPKRAILTRLGSNIVWDEEKLSIYFAKPLEALFKGFDEMKSLNEEFEPKKYQVVQGSNEKTEPKDPVFSTMLRDQDSNLEPTP